MSKNENLTKAKAAKNDEFYTTLSDIEVEVKEYRKHFKNQRVFCNCDDSRKSKFYTFFKLQFEILELRGLVFTGYNKDGTAQKIEVFGSELEDKVTELSGNGDFRSEESLEILKESDIVVTNPPFSLFREFVEILTTNSKKFLIVGPMQAITYKQVFPLIKHNKLWLGVTAPKVFVTPIGDTQKRANALWFTNLNHGRINKTLDLYQDYSPDLFPKYDNYDAIEVSRTVDIPRDYTGVMGVPISFLTKYNPTQFEILGLNDPSLDWKGAPPYVGGRRLYGRIFIKNLTPEV